VDPAQMKLLRFLLSGKGGGANKAMMRLSGGPYGAAAAAAQEAYPYIKEYYESWPGRTALPAGRGQMPQQPQFDMPGMQSDPFMGMRQTPVPATSRTDKDWEALQQIATDRLNAMMEIAKKRRAAGGTTKDVANDFQAIRKSGLAYNPGDFLRGAGVRTPKRGDAVLNNLQLKQPSR
jgi:hypothetical protein